MPLWQGKSKATPLGYRIFVTTLKSFGVQPAYFLLSLVSVYYFLFSPGPSKSIITFFHERLGYSKM
jgi:hypothetical protein